jgi:hypothetical protein
VSLRMDSGLGKDGAGEKMFPREKVGLQRG